jgi:hypothetical protein
MKSIKGKVKEQRPERVKPFLTGATEQIKPILGNLINDQMFIGENRNLMAQLLTWSTVEMV